MQGSPAETRSMVRQVKTFLSLERRPPGRRSLFGGYSAAVETSLPRLRGLTISARTFRRVALANVLWLFVIVSSGATVRLTGSGLGCEHWPGCNAGTRIFPTGYHSYVEFSNRVTSIRGSSARIFCSRLSC